MPNERFLARKFSNPNSEPNRSSSERDRNRSSFFDRDNENIFDSSSNRRRNENFRIVDQAMAHRPGRITLTGAPRLPAGASENDRFSRTCPLPDRSQERQNPRGYQSMNYGTQTFTSPEESQRIRIPAHSTAIGQLPDFEPFRESNISNISAWNYGNTMRTMPAQSTAIGQLPRHETFGSSVNSRRFPSSPSKPKSEDLLSKSPHSSDTKDVSSANSMRKTENLESKDECPTRKNLSWDSGDVSLLELFDKSVEKELARYRMETTDSVPTDIDSSLSIPIVRGPVDPKTIESMTSNINIIHDMKGEQKTELSEAVEKLAKAEAAVLFEGAVLAAEEAAANVPPEFAEEAAAAGAKAHVFNAEITSSVNETLPGEKPIEVIGYVGITRPSGKPKKS